MGTLELPARIVLGFFVIVDNLLPLLLGGAGAGVSYGAHIGGFAAGYVLARILDVTHTRVPRAARPRPAEPQTLPGQFRDALTSGRVREAAELFFEPPRRDTALALDESDKLALGRALEASGNGRLALAAYQRAIADHPTSPYRARAHLGAARVLMRELASPTAAYQHLYAAMEEASTGDDVAEARQLLAELRAGTRTVPRGRWG